MKNIFIGQILDQHMQNYAKLCSDFYKIRLCKLCAQLIWEDLANLANLTE